MIKYRSASYFALLFFAIFLTEIATDLYIPALSAVASSFEKSASTAQMTMSLHLIGFALAQPVYGYLLSRIRKNSLLLIGLTLFFSASLCCACASSLEQLIIYRFLQGVGACSGSVIGLAMIKDQFGQSTESLKMISIMTIVISVSPILGPIFGSILLSCWGWKSTFVSISLFACFVLPRVYSEIKREPEVKREINKKNFLIFLEDALSGSTLCMILINGVLVSCVWLFISEFPFISFNYYKLSYLYYSLCQVTCVLFYMLGNLTAQRISGVQTFSKFINVSLCCFGISIFLLFFNSFVLHHNLLFFILGVGLFQFGLGVLRPFLVDKILNSFINSSGIGSAIIGMSEMVMGALSIYVLGKFHHSTEVPFSIGLVLAMLFSMVLLMSIKGLIEIKD